MQSLTALLRELKGSPLSCLLALMLAGGPVGEKWIAAATGYSQNSVRAGLLHLREVNLVCKNARCDGWALTDGARQLPLLASGAPAPEESQKMTLAAATAATLIGENKDTEETAAEEEHLESQKLTLAALREAGLMGKTARDLARLGHVTPAFVRAHARLAQAQHKSSGILVCRLRDGDPIDADEDAGDSADQAEVQARRRYISGPLADYINW